MFTTVFGISISTRASLNSHKKSLVAIFLNIFSLSCAIAFYTHFQHCRITCVAMIKFPTVAKSPHVYRYFKTKTTLTRPSKSAHTRVENNENLFFSFSSSCYFGGSPSYVIPADYSCTLHQHANINTSLWNLG